MSRAQYESQVAFLSGVDESGKAAPYSYYTWEFNNPAVYEVVSQAFKWGSSTPGTAGGNVSYWFNDASNWSNVERAVWEGGFAMWSALADIDFSLAADSSSANISIIRGNDKGAYASIGTLTPSSVGSPTIATPAATGALVSIDTSVNGFGPLGEALDASGGYPYSTVFHEIGHIIGLGHSGPYNSEVIVGQQQFGVYDSALWSIMSYIKPWDEKAKYYGSYTVTGTNWGTAPDGSDYEPMTPMMIDILSIQRLYGEATDGPFSGGQVYGFNANVAGYIGQFYDFDINTGAVVTLWNSGTGNTLDLSGFSEDATVDLAPGTFSSAGGKVNNIAVALDTVIETGIGGSGNDTIAASNVASTLRGGAGNDVLNGGAGNDGLYGGEDDDVLAGGQGTDILNGESGNDSFWFTAGGANGDTIVDFAGNGAGTADTLQFFGYGLAVEGATFTQVDATHWSIKSADGGLEEVVTVANGASIEPGDYTFLPTYTELANSGYLDWASYRSGATLPTGDRPVESFTFNVALVLDRANDPTALLESSWASRQEQLSGLNEAGTLWSTYGADATKYANVLSELATLGIQTVDQVSATNGYVSSAEARTVWVQVNETNFTTLFGPTAKLLHGTDQSGKEHFYWHGNLSLPDSIASQGVNGLWFDTGKLGAVLPNPGTGTQATMPQGWQSPGNSAGHGNTTNLFPQEIADDYYNFPLAGLGVATGTIGLVEPGVGTALPGDDQGAGFQAAIDAYRAAAGISGSATVIKVAPGGQEYPIVTPPAFNPAGERSLDVGVVTAINPSSALAIYAGSGTAAGAEYNTYTAYQSSFWDLVNNPQVVTSSFGFQAQVAPDSPFSMAANELFIDAALRNISVFNDAGDGGSGNQFGNGLTNVSSGRASPYAVMVGGTSISTVNSASVDASLQSVVSDALAGDQATIWQLIASGLKSMPSAANGAAALIETVWNRYYLDGTAIANPSGTGFIHNNTGTGGVDPSRPTPWYQTAFGLTPTTSDPDGLVGRGVPDVAANAGGNMLYAVPGDDMTGVQNDDGTSAATPLWAALASQVDAIFADQGLPQLGYMNDLLYIAAVIAPGSFNDTTVGNNTSSFVLGGPITSDGQPITPTGFGYDAGPGYDLVTGLGTPNGTLLARALTQIAHHQTSFSDQPDLIESNEPGSWKSGTGQSLLIQSSAGVDTAMKVTLGADSLDFTSGVSSSYAWTARMAQQVLQADFDPSLVLMFDKQSQGALTQAWVGAGESISVSVGGGQAEAVQAGLSSAFGFADFVGKGGVVHLASAVAVAETARGANDQNAVVRLRQGGEDDLALTFYRVDDHAGTIGGLAPGEAGYAAAASGRAYATTEGGTSIDSPGYGGYAQTMLTGVDAGHLIAMQLTNQSNGQVYWAFSQANETVDGADVAHLWNYGANTWGWEDLYGGGDRDFNDLVVQLDFTSASGHGWLV